MNRARVLGVTPEFAGDAQQFLVRRPVQGVSYLGTGDRDDGDGAVALDLDCHERTLLALRWAAIDPRQLYPTSLNKTVGPDERPAGVEAVGWRVGAESGAGRRQNLPVYDLERLTAWWAAVRSWCSTPAAT